MRQLLIAIGAPRLADADAVGFTVNGSGGTARAIRVSGPTSVLSFVPRELSGTTTYRQPGP
ncbi:hypothetical protein OHA18_22005 [Kribbella sp. NBC_00709]|uniref:hypothetical protein n=1 Tax=Kribbella sp. NBC_00709 TaxID=2975972 RepID=UPI002E2C2851|nr:hypothetical protein [Kribbella sp. NBC_00709]